MSTLREAITRFLLREEGATLTEYALALVLIAAVTVGMITLLGQSLNGFFQSAASSI